MTTPATSRSRRRGRPGSAVLGEAVALASTVTEARRPYGPFGDHGGQSRVFPRLPLDITASRAGLRVENAFAVDDIEDVVARLRTHGAELIGEIAQYQDSFRLC